MSRIEAALYAGIGALIMFIIQDFINDYKIKSEVKVTPPYVQKFRFGEQCPDGLKVEYVSTIRLPKSIICQKAIGE